MLGDMNLVTTIIGFGMSSTFIVFVCTRLICGRLREGESRHTLDGGLEIDLEQSRGLMALNRLWLLQFPQ